MKRVLVLTSRFPYPLERGDKLRVYHHIRLLAEKADIFLFSLSDREVEPEDIAQLESFCSQVVVRRIRPLDTAVALLKGLLSRLPLQVYYFWRKAYHKELQRMIREIAPDVVYCQLLRMAPYAQECPIPAVMDYMDAFSLGMKRRVAQSVWWKRPLLQMEYRRLLKYEADMYNHFTRHAIISEQDRNQLDLPSSARSSIQVIPNGVDTTFFQPQLGVLADVELLFVGNMGYFPNVKAAQMLAREILPEVRRWQSATLMLAGARPSAEVQKLGLEPGVIFTGWVDDIRTCYARGNMFVAPLFAGSGQQNKILEAMAMGLPCIVTPIVNEAIGATPGEQVVIANSPEEFVDQVLDLLQHPEKRQRIGHQAREFVLHAHTWEATTEQVYAWLSEAAKEVRKPAKGA